ncbi:hypothetical protein HanIR_Chr07g0335671 [Helianthus annuus]|nr:hypothetical protein HanIR_Chr07g0335671 [Helianthus annuus]
MSASVTARDLPTTRSSSSWTFCCTSGCNTNLAKIHSIRLKLQVKWWWWQICGGGGGGSWVVVVGLG